ncbi:MAG: hypothetical protein ACPGC9_00980 [Cytophagales bacterium]
MSKLHTNSLALGNWGPAGIRLVLLLIITIVGGISYFLSGTPQNDKTNTSCPPANEHHQPLSTNHENEALQATTSTASHQ